MKKSLIALAVAGAFAAPAFAASSNVDVYGTIRMSLDSVNSDAANSDRWTINDQNSRFGIKGSEDLGGGLKAVWQYEQTIAVAGTYSDTTSGVAGTARNTFVGLAGGFGTVLIGRHDTPYKLGGSADLFGDTSADSQRAGTGGIIGRNGFDSRIAGTIAYVSPEWSGFHFAAAVVPGEQTGAVAANGLTDAISMVGVYANGPLKATLAYEKLSGDLCNAAGCSDADAAKFNIAYKIGDIGLGYTYERSDDTLTAVGKNTDNAHLASISYGMGPITLMGQYGKFNNNEANAALATSAQNDMTRWTLGASYALSKRTNAYAAYNTDDVKNTGAVQSGDVKTITMGLNHSF